MSKAQHVRAERVVVEIEEDLPTFERMLMTCNRTISKLESGEITPAVGNAIHGGIGTAVRIAKLEMDAARMLNRTPRLVTRLLPPAQGAGS